MKKKRIFKKNIYRQGRENRVLGKTVEKTNWKKKMTKKRISKKIFNAVKNRALGKKVEKKKQNIFAEKNLEKKSVLEFFPQKTFWVAE